MSIVAQKGVPDKPLSRGEVCQQQQELLHQAISEAIIPLVSTVFNQALCAEVTTWLDRDKGKHRASLTATVSPLHCPVCGRRETLDFVRKGYYARGLVTQWGLAPLAIPRIKCICGHAPAMGFSLLAPYERLWSDMDALSLEYTALSLSLRSTVLVLERISDQAISIGTVQSRVKETARVATEQMQQKVTDSPPVILLDGLWGTVMVDTGRKKTDKKGRLRTVKQAKKVPVLIAFGVDPHTGKKTVLGWVQGTAEDLAGWTRLLTALHERGVHWQNGLRLFIHDGSSGLEAALEMVDFGPVRRQRCVFHKLKNVLHDVVGSETMTREEKKERIKAVLTDACTIYQAKTAAEARQRAAAFGATWIDREPKAVATLERDFEQTLTCYAVQEEAKAAGQTWPLSSLRTTSALERFNRSLRTKWRQAGTFGSEDGQTGAFWLVSARQMRDKEVGSTDWLDAIIAAHLGPD